MKITPEMYSLAEIALPHLEKQYSNAGNIAAVQLCRSVIAAFFKKEKRKKKVKTLIK